MKYFPFLVLLFEIFILVHSIKIIDDLKPISGTIEKAKKSKYKSFAIYRFNLYDQDDIYFVRRSTSWFKELPKPNKKIFFLSLYKFIFY